jgi:hypothetical protein
MGTFRCSRRAALERFQTLDVGKETERFFAALKHFDDYLASSATLHEKPEKLLQAPIADALTHIGQIAMLRRMADNPIKGEGYITAEIVVGRVGEEQAPPNQEFG